MSDSLIRVGGSAAVLGLCLGLSGPVQAENGWDRVGFRVGAFWPDITTTARLDPEGFPGAGTALKLENDLGLDDSDTLMFVDGFARVTDRLGLEAGWFEIGRSGDSNLTGDIIFGDQTFPIDADVRTTFDTDIYEVGVRYSFLQNETVDMAASISSFWVALEAGIETEAGGGISESADADAPAPAVGLDMSWKLVPSVTLSLNGKYFSLDIEDIEGDLINYGARLQWDLMRFVAIGVGYEYFELDVDSENEDFLGQFNFEYTGPQAYTTLRF